MLMVNIDLMAVNLALGPIASSIGLGIVNAQWIINAYLLAIGMFIILGGYLGQRYGSKPIFLVGTLLFTIASLAIACAPTVDTLIIFRFIQGIGAALILPVSLVLVAEYFPKHQLAMAMALSVAVTGLGQAAGPYVGGLILQYLQWRWIFLINIPIGIVVMLLGLKLFERKKPEQKIKIDIIGNILLGIGLLFLLYGLNLPVGQSNTLPLIVLIIGIILLFVFIIYCKKATHPLINIQLFLNKYFFLTNGLRFIFQYCFFALLFILGLYLINNQNYSPELAGSIQLYMSVAFFVTSLIISKVSNWIGSYKLTTIGFFISTVAFLLLALLGRTVSMVQLSIALILVGVAIGILFATTTTMAMAAVKEEDRSVAIGVFLTIALIGGAIGVAISSVIIQSQATYLIQHLNSAFSPTNLQQMHDIAAGIKSSSSDPLMQAAAERFSHSFNIVMWVAAIMSGISMLTTLIPEKYWLSKTRV